MTYLPNPIPSKDSPSNQLAMSSSGQANKGQDFQIESLIGLLENQDDEMEELFVKAINLYAAPGSGGENEREKLDQLRLAVEQSLVRGQK